MTSETNKSLFVIFSNCHCSARLWTDHAEFRRKHGGGVTWLVLVPDRASFFQLQSWLFSSNRGDCLIFKGRSSDRLPVHLEITHSASSCDSCDEDSNWERPIQIFPFVLKTGLLVHIFCWDYFKCCSQTTTWGMCPRPLVSPHQHAAALFLHY